MNNSMRISKKQQVLILTTIQLRIQDNYFYAKTPMAHVSENTDLLKLWKEINEIGIVPYYNETLEQYIQTYTEPKEGLNK